MKSDNAKDLRERAEHSVNSGPSAQTRHPETVEALDALVHELEVHQTELQLQNESLRETELALLEARDRYFEIFDLAPVAYLTLDHDGTIVEANLAAATLLGANRNNLVGRKLSGFVTDSDAHRFHLYRQLIVDSGQNQTDELTLRRGDDTEFVARLESIAAPSAHGAQPSVRIALMDLTEVHQARAKIEKGEAELSRTKARFANVARFMMDSLVVISPDMIIRAVNPATLSLLGYDEEELVGQSFDKITGSGLSVVLHARNGVEGRAEANYIAKDGRRIPIVLSCSPVRSEQQDAVESIACVAHDVSEIKRKEQMIRLAVDVSPVAMLMVDERHNIVLVNAELEKLFGYPRSELLGVSIQELVPEDLRQEHKHQCEAYTLQPTARDMGRDRELFGRRKNGTLVPVSISMSPFRAPDGPRVLAAIADLSERKRLEEEVRQAQKMEAIGTLASGVAHDFNNLLMGVSGCANIALSTLEPHSSARIYLDEIKKSADSGAAISRQLLAFSRKKEVSLVVFNLNDLIDNHKVLLRRLLGEDIQIDSRLEARHPSVRADPGQIEQVLMNFAVNARDAMPEGGTLTITTRDLALTDANRSTLPAGDYISMSVTDSGTGMTDEARRHAFEPFFTTKPVGRGTGLGLSTVYAIVTKAGGSVDIRSKSNKGTTIEIRLPVARESLASESPSSTSEIKPEEQHGTILVVEDEAAVRMATCFYLEGAGYRVLEAPTAHDAIACAREEEGHVDILLTDVVLPGMGGQELAQQIQQSRPGIQVMFMSAYSRDWLLEAGRIEEGAQTIQKPFGAEELLARIYDTLKRAR